MTSRVDINEQQIYEMHPELLRILLKDCTTNRTIIWGTNNYLSYGADYGERYPMHIDQITGTHAGIIQPRVAKSHEHKGARTKEMAEVFTPSWICNAQNNLVDQAWFERDVVFNRELDHHWETITDKISFPEDKSKKTWKAYVDERRLEITCGEAPYLVSRYDTVTGEAIEIKDRIGLLDRKLRIVGENTETEDEWLKWAERAVQSTYGFEFQGDSLLLARENILFTYSDYLEEALKRQPSIQELIKIAKIIAWNIWQMDGLTFTIPYEVPDELHRQMTLFDQLEGVVEKPKANCLIKDWRAKEIIEFRKLVEKGKQ